MTVTNEPGEGKTSKGRLFIGAALFVSGIVLGASCGIEWAHYRANSDHIQYSQELVDSRIWSLVTSESTFAKAETKKLDGILDDQAVMIRGAFLTLVDLHKSGRYKSKEKDILKRLSGAKKFMEARPKAFLDQNFVSSDSLVDRINHPEITADPKSDQMTVYARHQLQAAFDYVDSLQSTSKAK